jgi:hypothetical protein
MNKRVTMIPGSEGPTPTGSAHDSGDDTIEVELTGEQQLALSRATKAAQARVRPDESWPVLSPPEYENFAFRRTARIDFVCNVTFVAAILLIAVAFLWPESDRHPPAPAVTSAAPLPQVITVAPPESEAREAVAEPLLSRVHDRRAEGVALRRAGNLQPNHGAEAQQAEVLVTSSVARVEEP